MVDSTNSFDHQFTQVQTNTLLNIDKKRASSMNMAQASIDTKHFKTK